MRVETLRFSAGADGGVIVCTAFGQPQDQVVILLHGGGQTRHTWRRTCRDIADRGFYAVAVDLKGHGQSYWDVRALTYGGVKEDAERNQLERMVYPNGDRDRESLLAMPPCERERIILDRVGSQYRKKDAPYSYHAFSDDLDRLLALAGWKDRAPVIVGASLGGLTALSCEAAALNELSGIVLVDVTPRLEPGGVSRVLDFMLEKAEDGFATAEEAAYAIARYAPKRAVQPPKLPLPGDEAEPLARLKQNLRFRESDGRWVWHWDPAFLASSRRRRPSCIELDFVEADLMQRARAIPRSCSVLLVRGRETDIVSVEGARLLADAIPHASFVDVADAGHMLVGDQNDVFSSAVVGFLLELKVRRGDACRSSL